MSVDSACPQSLLSSESSDSGQPLPVPETQEPEEDCASLQMSPAETLHAETAVSPLPPSVDLLTQSSPDSSTSPVPSTAPPAAVESSAGTEEKEEKAPAKKQKVRTVFSQTQLCMLNETFQRQKYLSLQQMQELSNILNLSYKQIKTWFQNQRMKWKRGQKYNWPKNSSRVTQMSSASAEYLGLSSCHQGCLVDASGNLPMWSNQTCSNLTWGNHSWNSPPWNYYPWDNQTWCTQAWNSQAWNNQTWNDQCYSYGEGSLQPQIQFQQNPLSDLEATLEIMGETYDAIMQAPKYCGTQQTMDLFPDYPSNIQPSA